jgi:WD40 repeat protein
VFTNHTSPILTGEFSPDGNRVITGGMPIAPRESGTRRPDKKRKFSGTADPVWAAAFSPDGRRVVTGGDSVAGLVWDADTGDLLVTLLPSSIKGGAYKDGAMFSPDGRWIVTSYEDTVRIWDSETGAQRHVFTGHRGSDRQRPLLPRLASAF